MTLLSYVPGSITSAATTLGKSLNDSFTSVKDHLVRHKGKYAIAIPALGALAVFAAYVKSDLDKQLFNRKVFNFNQTAGSLCDTLSGNSSHASEESFIKSGKSIDEYIRNFFTTDRVDLLCPHFKKSMLKETPDS